MLVSETTSAELVVVLMYGVAVAEIVTIRGVTYVLKHDAQSALPDRVGTALPMTARGKDQPPRQVMQMIAFTSKTIVCIACCGSCGCSCDKGDEKLSTSKQHFSGMNDNVLVESGF